MLHIILFYFILLVDINLELGTSDTIICTGEIYVEQPDLHISGSDDISNFCFYFWFFYINLFMSYRYQC